MVTRDEYVAGLHEVFDPIGKQIAWLHSNEVIEGQPFSKTAANFNDVRAMAAIVGHVEIITVYDGEVNALGQALNGPTGVVSLDNQLEVDCVSAVIDDNAVANTMEIDVYNAVLARGAAAWREAPAT